MTKGPLFTSIQFPSTKELIHEKDYPWPNKHIHCSDVVQEDHHLLKQALPIYSHILSFDLQDAFWFIPISPWFKEYLSFKIGRNTQHFKATSFGLSLAPEFFSSIEEVSFNPFILLGKWKSCCNWTTCWSWPCQRKNVKLIKAVFSPLQLQRFSGEPDKSMSRTFTEVQVTRPLTEHMLTYLYTKSFFSRRLTPVFSSKPQEKNLTGSWKLTSPVTEFL